jgi:hypothetical protein
VVVIKGFRLRKTSRGGQVREASFVSADSKGVSGNESRIGCGVMSLHAEL